MNVAKKVFWIAGESSGDLHASQVLAASKKVSPNAKHFGIGGPLMAKQGFDQLYPFARFSVMGFVEVVKHLRFFLNIEREIGQLFRSEPPDLVVLVDYPGLNMRIAKLAKSLGIPVLYYICPQFWAWKHKRIFKLKAYTDHIAYILPFEGKHLDEHHITSTYVGHPIAEEISLNLSKEKFTEKFKLDSQKKWLGFMPGSRDTEVGKILPEYVKAASKFDSTKYEILISLAHAVDRDLFKQIISTNSNIKVIEDANYEMMQYCDAMAVTSGTATLETAFTGTPFVLVYKTSKISYEIGKRIVKIKRIGLPNIILDQDLIPELIQDDADGTVIANNLKQILTDPIKNEEIKDKLQELHDVLGKKSASETTAKIIQEML